MTKKAPPLIMEAISEVDINHGYFTLLVYKKEEFLVIIDNLYDEEISAFVIDRAAAEDIDIKWFLSIANLWYYKSSEKYPLSFEFAKVGALEKIKPMLKTFNIGSVSRMVGRPFMFNIYAKPKIKRRKIVPIPEFIEIKLAKN